MRQVELDVDQLMQQIRHNVETRSPTTSAPASKLKRSKSDAASEALVAPKIQPRSSLIRKLKQKLLSIGRRPKQFGTRVYRFALKKKHAVQAKFSKARSEGIEPSIIAPPTPISGSETLTNVAILVPCLVDGDAVGNDVVGMYHALKQHGYNPQIFADTWTTTKIEVRSVTELRNFLNKPSDILLYHYSIGWNVALELLQTLNCKKVIKYHNVTPPEFYEGINEDYVSVCRAGRAQLKAIAQVDQAFYLSDSDYNASELEQLGVDPARSWVLPPFHLIDQLEHIEADFTVLDAYQDGRLNILMVGRLAPNKGHLALIDAFDLYHKTYNRDSRLIIAGKADPRLQSYNQQVQQKVKALNLNDAVVFTGEVSAAALKSYYLVSHMFMITSDHEGFCVPLVESMSIKLPIVAHSSSAIPSTVEKAGLVWPASNPKLLAGSIDQIARDPAIALQLGELGWQRYQSVFTTDRIAVKFMEILNRLNLTQ